MEQTLNRGIACWLIKGCTVHHRNVSENQQNICEMTFRRHLSLQCLWWIFST